MAESPDEEDSRDGDDSGSDGGEGIDLESETDSGNADSEESFATEKMKQSDTSGGAISGSTTGRPSESETTDERDGGETNGTEIDEPYSGGTHSAWGTNDSSTALDVLGFDTYVYVLKDFLTHEHTKPPLTVSIEGEWGTGKSSFMAMLSNLIDSEHERSQYITVYFNPWRHERDETLWATFMLVFFQTVTSKLRFRDRWYGHLTLLWRRFGWQQGRSNVLRLGVVVLLVSLAVLLPRMATALETWLIAQGIPVPVQLDTLGTLGQGASVFALGVWTWRNVATPIERELRSYIADPEYVNRVSFIERFHSDFGEIIRAYIRDDQRVFVFIDDLDRCPPSKVATVFQSINMMISTEDSRIFFILGMDRPKVIAAIAAKHEDIIRYLRTAEKGSPPSDRRVGTPDDAEAEDGREGIESRESGSEGGVDDAAVGTHSEPSEEMYGLEYAADYLEKFVQLKFPVPNAGQEGIRNLIRELVYPETGGSGPATDGPDSEAIPVVGGREEGEVLPPEDLNRILEMIAPVLEPNPRTFKTFVNQFRIQAMLVGKLGLFGTPEFTTEAFAKFVCIDFHWPRLTPSLRNADFNQALNSWARDGSFDESTIRGEVLDVLSGLSEEEQSRLATLLVAGTDDPENGHRCLLKEVPEGLFQLPWIGATNHPGGGRPY
jgi:hypothetical protein